MDHSSLSLRMKILAGLILVAGSTFASESMLGGGQLPPAVDKTIRTEVGNGSVSQITKVVENGETFFDVEAIQDGKEKAFSVTSDGALHIEIALSDAPEPVQKVIRQELGNATLDGLEKTTDNGEIFYDADLTTKDGKKRTLSVEPDGTLHEPVQINELPEAIRKIVITQLGSQPLEAIDKISDNGEIFYDVDTSRNGRKLTFSVSSDGSVRLPVEMSEIPEPVQKAIKQELGDGNLGEISKSTEADGGVYYEVEFTKGGQSESFSVSPEGTLYEVVSGPQTEGGAEAVWYARPAIGASLGVAALLGALVYWVRRKKG